MEIRIEQLPKDNPNAAAAVYPWLSVKIPAIDSIAHQMTGDDDNLLPRSSPTLLQPIEFVAPKGTGARWFLYQPDSVPSAVAELTSFSERWVFPFLDKYCDARAVIAMYRSGDDRILRDQNQFLRVIAAMLSQGDFAAAQETLEAKFGKPALRRRFSSVFEFVEQYRSRTSI